MTFRACGADSGDRKCDRNGCEGLAASWQLDGSFAPIRVREFFAAMASLVLSTVTNRKDA
jgi:hypothetical protein